MLRQSTPELPQNNSSTPGSSPTDQRGDVSEPPSSSSPRRMSKDSEGYPSWLPKRPPPPAPASTFQSSLVGIHDSAPIEPQVVGGRKPTPRSVRIVSLHDPTYAERGRREPTDQTRVSNPPRVWSRATGATMSPAVLSSSDPLDSQLPQPKFRSQGLHIELLRKPSLKSRLYFYIFPLLVFVHIPLQTFFDFNAVFILVQVSKFPNPQAPGVPGSGRNWALGATAYVACWFVWILVVCVTYELVYSFVRRWRVKRPLILPIYLSSPAFNLVAMRSYSNFCFLQHIRYSAFFGESGSLRDGLAETFWFYSQNLPTIALLFPRAGLALALLLAFSSPQVGIVALADAGISHRDATFFRQNGTLTSYARGVLIANAAWTAWRVIVLWTSWIGLWVVSGQGCAGLCGPRYRWEEADAEKNKSLYSDTASELDAIPWSWRECTRMRIQEAFEFCLTVRPSLRWTHDKKETSDTTDLLGSASPGGEPFEGMEQVLAAVGFPSVPPPARRGVLSDDLFESPKSEHLPAAPSELSDIIPKVVKRLSKEKQVAGPSAPLMSLPYPFTAQGAQMSSADQVPFPPSPGPTGAQGLSDSTEEEDDDQDQDDEDEEEEEMEEVEQSEEPSTGRASGSMSSLGQPVSSRYPFQFRRPGRGNSISSGAPSHMTPTSNSRSMQSRISHSTGNRESSDSQSPKSHTTSGSEVASISQSRPIPMPPRHPQQSQGRGRARAGTVPAAAPSSPMPVVFPMGSRPRASTRVESGIPDSSRIFEPVLYGSELGHGESDNEHTVEHAEPDSHEAEERDDVVGLLSPSAAPSPKTSITALRNRASTLSQHRLHGSGSESNSRTNSHSSSSRSRTNSKSVSVRSRAQSLMQNIGAASHSSLELVQTAIRSRANSSMARLEEDSPHYSDAPTHSRSGSSSDAVQSSNENYTFGHPLRTQWHIPDDQRLEEESVESRSQLSPHVRESLSSISESLPSQQHSERTVLPRLDMPEPGVVHERSVPIEIPRSGAHDPSHLATSSPPDISTAAQSFVTAPATIEGTTESSGRTISSWGDISHMVDRSDGTWRPAPA